MGRLEGRVAVVTGGASGIGAATAALFVAEGAHVVIGDLQGEVGEETAGRLGATCSFHLCNVAREEDVACLVGAAVDQHGRLDIMFNNAGFIGATGPIDSISEADFDLTFDVLLKGVFFGMKHAAPIMKAQRRGSIINTSSAGGKITGGAPHLYSTAKRAVIHLTQSVANELAEHDVRVNSVCPGWIATPLAAGAPIGVAGRDASERRIERLRGRVAGAQALQRVGEPEDIAGAVLFLACDASSWITGHDLVVDGGFLTGPSWRDQSSVYTDPHPIRMYRPES